MSITENTFETAIDQFIPHPKFQIYQPKYDIALIKMAKEVSFSDYIRPICLPVNQQLRTISQFELNGWGRTGNGRYSGYLQSTTLNVTNCDEYPGVDDSQICAGSDTSDSCSGDGGGPLSAKLSYEETARIFLIGIVSFGLQSCHGSSSVYTNVTYYLDWVKDTIHNNKLLS
ncbi:CLIP domain-containing serine protease B15 [Drosophila biarmipes]|uniref:CLIP domain-containing serine protease B15 n=1 Tax=Drosophila biarmipes TaxID=125945 RepID=UPI0007E63310|nr:CLIP domain-containing serine protease B15 [Drosophila biarmipes]XP_050743439.1 CLIP domain-containing serine protease B15 [Drosophila biarmipes]XP_050743440.1 CLIP domain-containing serine protease B15 [Drosophila biarmipes]